jgi:predicted transposase/invertase (TIGR01784 family)
VICDHDLLPEERAYINDYELRNKRSGKSFTDLVKLIILEIPKLSKTKESEVWPWLKLFTCKWKEQYEELGRRYPEVNMAVKVLKELSLIGRIRMLADAREMQRRDNQAALEYQLMEVQERGHREGFERGIEQGIEQGRVQGIEQGIERGIEQGRVQGIEQGSRQSRLEIARRMKNRDIPPDQIAEDTGLSSEDIANL